MVYRTNYIFQCLCTVHDNFNDVLLIVIANSVDKNYVGLYKMDPN